MGDGEQGIHTLLHRQVDMAALSVASPGMQGGADGESGHQAGCSVGNIRTRRGNLGTLGKQRVQEPGLGLKQQIVGGAPGVRAGLAETR